MKHSHYIFEEKMFWIVVSKIYLVLKKNHTVILKICNKFELINFWEKKLFFNNDFQNLLQDEQLQLDFLRSGYKNVKIIPLKLVKIYKTTKRFFA